MQRARFESLSVGVRVALAVLALMTGIATAQDPPATAPASQPAVAAPSAPVAEQPTATQPAPAQVPPAPPAPAAPLDIRFNFKGATYRQVIDFFARSTGLPVVWESDVPEGTLDYVSPRGYDMPEALRILNIILQSKGVMLRVDGNMLYLQKLTEMAKENIPTFTGTLPESVTDDQIVTVVLPLKIALAKNLAEKLGPMVNAAYGSVAAMEQQNSLMITETAGQVRRLLSIVGQLDQADPEGQVEIFAIQHAKATELMTPLKALLSQRVEKYVINQEGRQVKLEEDQMPGLTITADERTNSIIAKGVQAKIDGLRTALKLLDVPASADTGGARTMYAATLSIVSAQDAANRLRQLFERGGGGGAGAPAAEGAAPPRTPNQPPRPTIIALDEMSKVVMLGTEAQIAEAKGLIRELEGEPSTQQPNDQPGAEVIELERANAQAVVAAVQSMLTRRQAAVMKIAPGPDGKSILVTGLPGDVASVRALAQALDRQAPADKQVRQVRIAAGDPVKIVDQARKLFDEQSAALDETSRTISVEVDPEARVVTAVGSARAIEQFTATLRMIEGNVTVAREARRVTLANVLPSEIAGPLNTLAQPLLQPSDGSQYIAPTFTPVDQLNTLVITATPEQLAVLESLAASLDSKEAAVGGPGMPPLRILQLKIADAASVANALMNQYSQRSAAERKARPVNIAADPVTNALLVAAHPDLLGDIQTMVEELNTVERTDLEGREIRIFPLKVARAEQLARTIDEMYPAPPPPLDARGRPLPQLAKPREVVVRADAQTNSLIIDAPVQRMAGFQQLVEQLDRAQLSVETQVRTYRVEHANLDAVAQTLRQLAASNSLGATADQRAPTSIATEPVSKALVVSGPAEIFARVETVLKDLDVQRSGPATTLRFFTLKNAKAETIAEMLRQVLLTRIAQDLPEAKNEAAALLNVTADRKTNTLILSAPEAIMPVAETLIQQLDSGTASVGDPIVRVKPLTFADAGSVSQSLMAALPSMVSKATGEPVSVKLFAGPGSNAIIMVGLETELAEVEALIEPLDARPTSDAMDAKTFTLQHADATKISQTVQNLLNDQQETDPRILLERIRASRGQLNLTPKIRVEADARTNSLIVSGPQQALALAETLIKQLDAPDDQSQRVSSVFTPKNSLDITALAASVKRVIDATGPIGGAATRTTLEIVAEPQSGAIVVIGPEAESQRAMAMLAERDAQALAAPQIDLRLISLKNSPAEMLAQIVQGLLRDQSRWPADLRAIVRAGVSIAQPSVFPDVASNRLLISAPAQLMPLAGQLVTELDQERSGDAERSVQVLTLVNADAAQLATSLDAVFAEDPAARKPVIRVDAASNSLLVRGTTEQFHAIEDVVKRVDQAALASGRQMKVVPLDPARGSAADIAAALKKMLQRDGEGGPTVEVMTLDELLNSRNEGVKPQATPASDSQSSAAGVSLQAMFALCMLGTAQDAAPPDRQEPDVTIAVDQATNSLIFLGAPRAVERIIALMMQLQQQLPAAPGKIRSIALPAELDARHIATMITQTLQKYTPVAGQPGDLTKRVSVLADGPSNALIVAANDIDFKIVSDLIAAFAKPPEQKFPVRTITLAKAPAESVAQAIQQFYDRRAQLQAQTREGGGAGGAGQPKAAVAVMAIESSNTLLVCANDADFADVQKLVEQFDTAEAAGALTFKVFQLQHARATEIQRTVQQLVNDLIYSQPDAFMYFWPPRSQSSKKDTIAVQADARLNTLIVTGRGDKFDVVEQMIEILDAAPPEGAERIVKLYRPTHAPISLVADMISSAFNASRQRRPWETPDPTAISVRADENANVILISASAQEHEQIGEMIRTVDQQMADAGGDAGAGAMTTKVLAVKFGRAREIADTLSRFLTDRAKATNASRPRITIASSDGANSLIVAATEGEIGQVEQLLAQLDLPDVAGDRTVEIIALQHGNAEDIARLIKEQFGRRAAGQGAGLGVIVTADARTNTLIINAPAEEFAQAQALIARLDAPSASDETIIRTYALKGAKADEAMRILQQTLQLDARGRTSAKGIAIKLEDSNAAPVQVKASVVADRRSNSLLVTATQESFPVIESLIKKLEEVPAASPVEWRIVRLQHALASEVSWTLSQIGRAMATDGPGGQPQPRIDYNRVENQLVIAATADQFKQIDAILKEIDQPSPTQRTTDFVPLKFAEAEKVQEALSIFYGSFAAEADTPGKRNVRIVADPATNSLVISAGKDEWEGIRGLLAKLDSEQYDASLQLKVLPLIHADATSVSRAINEAFQGQVTGDQRAPGARNQPRPRPQGGEPNRPEDAAPTLLVENEDWVRASAEPQTNSVIVSASRQNLAKVEEIIKQLDVADYATLPAPRIIAIKAGDPLQMATALQALYEQSRAGGGGAPNASRRATRIVGNAASNAIIIRAEEEEFVQIQTLAEALQQQAIDNGLNVSIIRVASAPAARIASAITEAFAAKAKQLNQSLSIKVDATGNNLIVAAPGPITDEIKATAAQLDALAPAAGQGIFIIDLQNIPPETAKTIIETIGLDKAQPADSNSRIVVEPIKVSLVPGRNGIVIVGNPADRDTLVKLLQSIDVAPAMAEAQVIVVPLKHAQASAVATLLQSVLKPGEQQADTPLARAIREQVRRLSVHRGTVEGGGGGQDRRIELDLSKPVKITPEPATNALIVSSTYENVVALQEIIGMFDRLPITDAVTVQIFPLQNIAAEQFSRIVRDLFTQGKTLGKVGRTNVVGEPDGAAGKALLNEIAMSTDDRTNSLIVAGTEEAVALVEVLRTRLDNDMSSAWVEPKVLPLRYADAAELASTLDAILVQGAGNLPQSSPLQKQVARLRLARLDGNGGQVLESDVFTPMTRLVIRPETQLNALILVGTPANIEVVSELVAMLDIEAASPADAVRIYPLESASASRLATTIKSLFDQQVQSKSIRPEDRIIVQPDERTNALVVATSPRSFAVLENLLKTLDTTLTAELSELKQIELKNAAAPRLASLIQQLMDARTERLRKVSPETADSERATVVADARTNSLIVAAGKESFEVIKSLAADLDTSSLGDAALVRVLPVVGGGNLDRLAQTINQIMQRRYADMPADVRNSQRPLVMTDARTNSLLVAANPEDFEAIEDLVGKLAEAPTNPAVGLHVIPLGETSRAELLAPRLQKLMQDRAASLGPSATPSDRVTIEPDPASNSLIVAASAENLEVVRGLIDMLIAAEREAGGIDDNGQRLARVIEFVPLTSSRAADIVELLDDLYVTEANRTRGQNIVRVTADERLNAVLINAPASDVRALKNLVAQLDGARPASVVEIKYVPLQSANAVETVSLIENVLSGRGIGARRNPRQATVLKYLRQIARGETDPARAATQPEPEPGPPSEVEMQVSAAIRESITLTPDLRTNTIIVAAPRESIGMIEQMIRDLDSSSVGSKNIRIFKLTNADALAMAEILADLFKLRQGSSMYVLKPREDGGTSVVDAGATPADAAPAPAPDNVLAGLSGTDLTAVPDERQQLAITVDSRTNSLIVSGTPTYLDLVAKVVEELDDLEANEREVYVYQLRNAVAAEVARVVSEFVDTEQQKLIGTLAPDQLGSAARLLEREITIKGDDASNTVLVSASPRYMTRVKEMIKQLDVDPPQVLIQVMLAEVTLDSREDWGVNLRAAVDIGSTTISGGYGLAKGLVPGLGVPNIAIASDDFNLLIRALRAQGRLQVLSNPSIMAANNSPARIQVGETVRLPAYTAISDTGQTSTTLEKEELGVILEVTPSINPDGFVRMEINPEISNLSQRTTQISEDFSSPIITRRNADTTVTVQDGQTIVIGGLISDRFERRDRKVPLLGDLPIVGPLFRSNTEETAKTELLIVLTPHVIDSPAHFDRVDEITQGEIDRLSLPESVKEQIRKGMLEGTGGLYDAKGNPIKLRTEEEGVAEERTERP